MYFWAIQSIQLGVIGTFVGILGGCIRGCYHITSDCEYDVVKNLNILTAEVLTTFLPIYFSLSFHMKFFLTQCFEGLIPSTSSLHCFLVDVHLLVIFFFKLFSDIRTSFLEGLLEAFTVDQMTLSGRYCDLITK